MNAFVCVCELIHSSVVTRASVNCASGQHCRNVHVFVLNTFHDTSIECAKIRLTNSVFCSMAMGLCTLQPHFVDTISSDIDGTDMVIL